MKRSWYEMTEPRNAEWKRKVMRFVKKVLRWKEDRPYQRFVVTYSAQGGYSKVGTYGQAWMREELVNGLLRSLSHDDYKGFFEFLDVREDDYNTTVRMTLIKPVEGKYQWKLAGQSIFSPDSQNNGHE